MHRLISESPHAFGVGFGSFRLRCLELETEASLSGGQDTIVAWRRMPIQVTRDPDVAVGPYRILRRTDGAFFIYDDRREIGRRTVGSAFRGIEDAESCAHMMWTSEQERES